MIIYISMQLKYTDYVSDLYEYEPLLKKIVPGIGFVKDGKQYNVTHHCLFMRQLLLEILRVWNYGNRILPIILNTYTWLLNIYFMYLYYIESESNSLNFDNILKKVNEIFKNIKSIPNKKLVTLFLSTLKNSIDELYNINYDENSGYSIKFDITNFNDICKHTLEHISLILNSINKYKSDMETESNNYKKFKQELNDAEGLYQKDQLLYNQTKETYNNQLSILESAKQSKTDVSQEKLAVEIIYIKLLDDFKNLNSTVESFNKIRDIYTDTIQKFETARNKYNEKIYDVMLAYLLTKKFDQLLMVSKDKVSEPNFIAYFNNNNYNIYNSSIHIDINTFAINKIPLIHEFFIRFKKSSLPQEAKIIMQDEYGNYYLTDSNGIMDKDYTDKIQKIFNYRDFSFFFGVKYNPDITSVNACFLQNPKECYNQLANVKFDETKWNMFTQDQQKYNAFRILKALGILPMPVNNVYDFTKLLLNQEDLNMDIIFKLVRVYNDVESLSTSFQEYIKKLIKICGKMPIHKILQYQQQKLTFKAKQIIKKNDTQQQPVQLAYVINWPYQYQTGGGDPEKIGKEVTITDEQFDTIKHYVNSSSKLTEDDKKKIVKEFDDFIETYKKSIDIDNIRNQQLTAAKIAYVVAQQMSPNLIMSWNDALAAFFTMTDPIDKHIKQAPKQVQRNIGKLIYILTQYGILPAMTFN